MFRFRISSLASTYQSFFFNFMWQCLVTNFFITKPTICTNFTDLFCHETLHVSDSSSVHHQEFIHCTLSKWYMSYRFVDSFRAGTGWNCSHVTVHRDMWPCCIVTDFFLVKPTDALIAQIYFVKKLYMFRAVPLSIIRILFTVHSAMLYVIQAWWQLSRRTRSCSKAVYKPVWHIPFAECTVNKLLMMDRGTARNM